MATQEQVRTILITGATGGLGSALALECAGRGARVVLLDRKRRPLEALCGQIEALGAPAPGYVEADLSQVGPEGLSDLVTGLVEAYGGIDALVHCAARFQALRPLDQVPPEEWLLDLQVNLNAAWLLTVYCLPSLRERRGKIAFVTDPDAEASAYWGSYGVSKGALRSLAAILRDELETSGCEVLVIEPGPLRTDLRAAAYLGEDPESVPEPAAAAHRIANALLAVST